jgi:flagellar FliJ protein
MELFTMFHFRLSKVLAYRRIQEERLKRELLEKQHRLTHEETILTTILQERSMLEDQLFTSQGKAVPGHQLQMWGRHHQDTSPKIESQNAIIAEASKALNLTRKKLLLAQQKKKVLEKLRDKAFDEHLQNEQKVEQRFLDEIGIMRSQHGY